MSHLTPITPNILGARQVLRDLAVYLAGHSYDAGAVSRRIVALIRGDETIPEVPPAQLVRVFLDADLGPTQLSALLWGVTADKGPGHRSRLRAAGFPVPE